MATEETHRAGEDGAGEGAAAESQHGWAGGRKVWESYNEGRFGCLDKKNVSFRNDLRAQTLHTCSLGGVEGTKHSHLIITPCCAHLFLANREQHCGVLADSPRKVVCPLPFVPSFPRNNRCFGNSTPTMDGERQLVIDDVLGGIQARLSLEGTVLEQRAAELKT